ncbi:MAG: ASKHA domain-containing protein [Kiritimatiellia bacterium]
MTSPQLRDENGRELPIHFPPQPRQLLSVWLSRNGYALNTRCGERGLCRGCELRHQGEPLKACQCIASDWAGKTLLLPRTSRHDASIHGISAFEVPADLLHTLEPLPEACGVALDLGTTTLAASFWQGAPPRCIRSATRANPQRIHGDNVVSRIQFSLDHYDGRHRLRDLLLNEGIHPLLREACGTEIPPRIFVSGNPAMLHILAGESLKGLASWPFAPVFLDTRKVEIDGQPFTLLPSLGPFVGSDVLAGVLACGCLEAEPPSLLIDFGTNGEILLHTQEGLWATATAAGPAFEGGRLQCGAAAGPGVISRFSTLEDLNGGTSGHAISGAAYVDALALARAADWLSGAGRFQGIQEIRPAPEVIITEADIAELLQAKAAIQAGWTTLCEVAGIDPADLRHVYIAGGFGYHLTPVHARAIGLIPPVASERIHLVGNASLAGATLGLLTANALPRMESLRAKVRLIELNQIESFEDNYIDSLGLE